MEKIRYYGLYDNYGNRSLDSRIIQYFVTKYNAFGDYVDELQAMGYTDVDYTPVISPTPETPVTPPAATETPVPPAETPTSELTPAPPAPTAFTVTPLDPPKTMWATQQVNYRDGADTTYNKVGQLNQHDHIIVTGIASTNWYQFSLDGGATYVYASNNYFTDVDPSNRSVIIDNPETGSYTAYEFSETDSSVFDKAIEQSEEDEQKASEFTTEEEMESVETTEEMVTESETELVKQSEEVISDMTEDTIIAESSDTIEVNDENSEEIVINETVSVLKWQYIVLGAILIVMAGFIIPVVKKHKK